jgi:glycine/D-amino acid oxidase-like deaminating enzyme
MPGGRGSDPEEERMETQPTSVLVVGGSLVGLSAAVYLAGRVDRARRAAPGEGR